MNIGLLDIDGKNFPNLALMKISSYHKTIGDNVEFATMFNNYDILYKSKIFTFTDDNEYYFNANKIVYGGTGYDETTKLPEEIENVLPDYSLYDCQHAYGFLTRGCPNKCSWCIVPKKEGEIKPYADINDFIGNFKSAILMDNNVLANEHGIKQIEKIIKLKIKVDFNQGLDARLIDKPMAKLLAKVKWLKPLRMACDQNSQMPFIEKATKYLREENCTPKNYFIYTLVKDIEDAYTRVMFLRNLNLDPFCQAYIDFSGKNKVTSEQKRFCRWVNHKAIFKSVLWENYQ